MGDCRKHPIHKAAKLIQQMVNHGPCPCKEKVSPEYSEAYYAGQSFCRSMGLNV
jgi:hypothetical protein